MVFAKWRAQAQFKLLQCFVPSRGSSGVHDEDVRLAPVPELPEDVWVTVFHLLDLKSLASVEVSCREFRDVVRRNPPLFESAYGRHATITSGQAAKVLEVYTARPAVSWRRACMFRVGLEAICEYARRREELMLLTYASDACTQTLASDKAALKLLSKKVKQHNASMIQLRSRGDLDGAARESSARSDCLARKAGKESSICIWKVLLPHFKARMKEVAKDEAAAKARLFRIYAGFPSYVKANCTNQPPPSQGLPTLYLMGRNWGDTDNTPANGNVVIELRLP